MIKVGSDFSGVGAFDQALKNIKINYKNVFACDIDKYARTTYLANNKMPSDYPEDVYNRKIPSDPLDIYMSSPPCQSFSLSGNRKGEHDERGILFYNTHEFIKKNNPRFFIIENVKGLLSDDNGRTFGRWLEYLGGKSINGNPVIFPYEKSAPYHIYWRVLNAKEHGVPQNRERVFIVGIRDDKDNIFRWANEIPLKKKLKDVLEMKVDEKYFLNGKMLNGFKGKNINSISNTIRVGGRGSATDKHNWDIINLGYINQDTQASKVFCCNGIFQTLCAGTHGYANGYVKVKSATKKGYEVARIMEDSINLAFPDSLTRRGRVGKRLAQTLDTSCNQGIVMTRVGELQIRRLTPRECFRLMDFPDTFDITKVSDTQAYKQAGNSIVVQCLVDILKPIIKNMRK